jgi:FkbM family methyltransferase
MNSKYHYQIPLKTKFLNLFRRLFKIEFLERPLTSSFNKKNSFFGKFVPPEYLYTQGSWRTIKRGGTRLELDISNVVDHEIYFNQYETLFIDFVKRQKEIKTFWDVGANIGWTSLQFAVTFPEAIIYAFEPSQKNRQRLTKHLASNNINGNVVPYGLGSEKDTFKLYSVLVSNPGMNRILTVEENLPFEEIEVITGDYYWQTIGKPQIDLIKIDVEGFEMAVLKGMRDILVNCKPRLFIEVDNKNLNSNRTSSIELLTWLSDKGYELTLAQTGKRLFPPFVDIPSHFDVIAK